MYYKENKKIKKAWRICRDAYNAHQTAVSTDDFIRTLWQWRAAAAKLKKVEAEAGLR